MSSALERYKATQYELNMALAQKAMIDEKIVALRNVLQGAALGVELEKAAQAERVAAEAAAQKEPTE